MMPRLTKGAKWTYEWVVVGPRREIAMPPEAWKEYGFTAGTEALFIEGSRTSGGFSICTRALLDGSVFARRGPGSRLSGRGCLGKGTVILPPGIAAQPGDQLLTVRGSCCGLGFAGRGRIFMEAMKHPELKRLTVGCS